VKTRNLKLDESIGEVICPQCNGNGFFCNKCLGTGKLDWVEQIVGKKPKEDTFTVYNTFTVSDASINGTINTFTLEDEIRRIVSEELAKKIDEDILKSLMDKFSSVKEPTNLLEGDK